MRILLISFFILCCFGRPAGQVTLGKVYSPGLGKTERSGDHMIVDLSYNRWFNLPPGIEIKPWSVGFNAYLFKDYVFGKSNYSLGIGFGVGADRVHSNGRFIGIEDTVHHTFFTALVPIDSSFKKNKLALTYLEIPVELRFKSTKKWRFTIGGKWGWLVNPHDKYVDASGKYKNFNIRNFLPFRYGGLLRAGKGNVNFFAFYQFSSLFRKDKGTEVVPVNFGFSFFLF